MSDKSNYDWPRGVFNPSCVCGGSINRPNADCERCAMHVWVYKQANEIERLRKQIADMRATLPECWTSDEWSHLELEDNE